MSSFENQIERDLEDIFKMVLQGISSLLLCFFYGIYEIRKKKRLAIFAAAIAVSATILIGKHFFELWDYGYVTYAYVAIPPVAVLLVLGLIYRQTQEYYCKIFTDVGFKGKDGKTPRCLSKSKKQGKTTIYFKSNIPLATWNKNIGVVQTALDCNVLVAEQGRSKRIVKLVYVPTDYDVGDFLPWKSEYLSEKLSEFVLGESISSQIKYDLNITPHWIFAGPTNCGKSVTLRLVVFQCILKGFRTIIMDFKRGVEFGRIYDEFCEVIMEKKRAVEVLQSLVQENIRRLDVFREKSLKNIEEYNRKYQHDPLERIVLFVDELAILLMPTREKGDKELTASATDALENLAILGRAAGITMVFGIQRPDANTVTGQIKSNVTGRICGYFSDQAPSLIVLNNTKANELPSKTKGRFMFKDGEETLPFQSYYLDDEKEIQKIIYERKAAELMANRAAQPGLSPELREDYIEDAAPAPATKGKMHKKPISGDMDFDYYDC